MRNVHKRNPGPSCLTTAEAEAKASGILGAASWTNDLRASCVTAVREAIHNDQQGLCCYCGGTLTPPTAGPHGSDFHPGWSVEHLAARAQHPTRALDWANLLGVCQGRVDGAATCDKARGDRPLNWSPLTNQHLSGVFAPRLTGSKRGEIADGRPGPPDESVAKDLQTLNLNDERLILNRREALQRLSQELRKDDSAATLRKLYTRYTKPHPLPEYAHILAAYVRSKAAQRKLSLP